jgi:hypothetical protein
MTRGPRPTTRQRPLAGQRGRTPPRFCRWSPTTDCPGPTAWEALSGPSGSADRPQSAPPKPLDRPGVRKRTARSRGRGPSPLAPIDCPGVTSVFMPYARKVQTRTFEGFTLRGISGCSFAFSHAPRPPGGGGSPAPRVQLFRPTPHVVPDLAAGFPWRTQSSGSTSHGSRCYGSTPPWRTGRRGRLPTAYLSAGSTPHGVPLFGWTPHGVLDPPRGLPMASSTLRAHSPCRPRPSGWTPHGVLDPPGGLPMAYRSSGSTPHGLPDPSGRTPHGLPRSGTRPTSSTRPGPSTCSPARRRCAD